MVVKMGNKEKCTSNKINKSKSSEHNPDKNTITLGQFWKYVI